MQKRMLSMAEAKKVFAKLPAQFSEECSEIIITHNNQPVLTIMPYKTHQEMVQNVASLQTMLEIMLGDDPNKVPNLKVNQKKSTEPATWEDFQKEVGW